MRRMFKNAAIGATVSSALVLLFFAIRRASISVSYVWVWGAIAGVCYGWFAVKVSIYGRAGVVLQNWKNVLLGIAILVGILVMSLKVSPFVHASAEDPIAVVLAASISMIVSDALEAPNQRSDGWPGL
ncbi:MAG TPA: hypothetical protein VHQ22_19055 [Terriglobales bacterium]|nr:hypothetical protein [Terriglobales bacterium]